jgi:hypothetical protein
MPREARACDMHPGGSWTGSDSFVFAVRIESFLAWLYEQTKYFNWFSGLQILSLSDCVDSGSTAQSTCGSLNKWPLPRLPSPRETLRQRIDLIVMAAGWNGTQFENLSKGPANGRHRSRQITRSRHLDELRQG